MGKFNMREYDNEYKREMMEQINIRVLKRWTLKDAIAQAAKQHNISSREYILASIFDHLKQDGCLPEAIEGENKTD